MPTTLSDTLFTPANYIEGQWSFEGDGTFNTVLDKYHGTELAKIPHATVAQMEAAIASAYASRAELRRMSAGDRSAKLTALADLAESETLDVVDLLGGGTDGAALERDLDAAHGRLRQTAPGSWAGCSWWTV